MPPYLHSGAAGHAGLLPEDTFASQSTFGTPERTSRLDKGTTCWGKSSCWWCACLPGCTLWSGADLVSSLLIGTGVCSVTVLSHHGMSYQGWTWAHSFHHSHVSQNVLNNFLKFILFHHCYFQIHFFQLQINLHKDGKDILAWKMRNSAIRYSST